MHTLEHRKADTKLSPKYSSKANTTIVFLVLVVMSILTYYKLLISPGIIAYGDMIFPYGLEHMYRSLPRSIYAWDSHIFLGYYSPLFPDTLLFKLAVLTLMMIFPAEAAAKVWLILTLFFSGVTMYFMTYQLTGKKRTGFISALLYMYNPWILERILSGHVGILMGYAAIPLLVGLYIGCLNDPKSMRAVKVGLMFALLIASDIYFAILASFLMILYSAFHIMLNAVKPFRRKEATLFAFKGSVISFSIVICTGLSLHAFWIVPLISNTLTQGVLAPSHLLVTREIEQLYSYSSKAQLINVIRTSGYWIAHFEKIIQSAFSGKQILYTFWLLSGLSLAALAFSVFPLLRRWKNEKYLAFFTFVALIGTFLGKGPNEPVGYVYTWLFTHIFPSARVLFYEPNKFVYLVVFSYAFLIGVMATALSDKLQNKLSKMSCELTLLMSARLSKMSRKLALSISVKRKRISSTPLIITCLLVLTYSWPMITGNFYGELSTVMYPEEYKALDRWLAAQKGDYRVLFLPPWYFTKYDWLPSNLDNIREHLIVFPAKPVVALGYGDLSDRFTRFVLYAMYYNKTEYVGKLLGLLGIKYIILRTDARDLEPGRFNTTEFRFNVLPHLQGIREVWRGDNIFVYENGYYSPRFFASQNIAAVAGDRRILTSLSFVKAYDPKLFPMMFVGQTDTDTAINVIDKSSLIIVQDDKVLEVVFSMMKDAYFIMPWLYASGADMYKTWVSSSKLYWATGLEVPNTETDYWIITKAYGARSDMPFTVISDGLYEIWVKLFTGPFIYPFPNVENKLTFMINGETLEAAPQQPSNDRLMKGFVWTRVASCFLRSSDKNTLSMINGNGTSIVSRIAVVPHGMVDNRYKQMLNVVEQIRTNVVYVLEPENSFTVANGWTVSTQGCLTSNALSFLSSNQNNTASSEFHVIKPGMHMLALRMASDAPRDLTVTLDDAKFELQLGAPQSWIEFNHTNGWYYQFQTGATRYSQTIEDSTWVATVQGSAGCYVIYRKPLALNYVDYPYLAIRLKGSSNTQMIRVRLANSSDSTIWFTDIYPIPTSYTSYTRKITGTGNVAYLDIAVWSSDGNPATAFVNSIMFYPQGDLKYGYYYAGPVDFNVGKHLMTISTTSEHVHLDQIIFYSVSNSVYDTLDNFFGAYNYTNVDYDRVNPCQYKLNMARINTPTFPVFLESYYPTWRARYSDKESSPIIVYSYANGFLIDKANYDQRITVQFLGYKYQKIGMLLSTISLTVIIAFFLIGCLRHRKTLSNRICFK